MQKLIKTNQVKVTLPTELHLIIKSQADRFGLTLSSYIRNLILDDVKKQEVPIYAMNEKQEKIS